MFQSISNGLMYQFPIKQKLNVGQFVSIDSNGYAVPSIANTNVYGIVVKSTKDKSWISMASGYASTDEMLPKSVKKIVKCSKCKEELCTFYSENSIGNVLCVLCYQLEKLKE